MSMPITSVTGVAPTAYLQPAATKPASDGSAFGSALAQAVDGLQAQQSEANRLQVAAVTGDLSDIQQATIAATRAQVTMELVSTVRNRGVEAFNEIMRMQA